jgi:hypothetical protein
LRKATRTGILLVDPTLVVGTNRPACPVEGVEVTLCITVCRADLFWREAHRASEMRSGEDLRSTVFQLAVELAWLVAAFHQGLTDRSGCRGSGVCGGHRIAWCWRWWPARATEQH